jgi:hypothetical protein
MTTTVLKNRENMTGPLLMAANPHGFFQLADSLSHARRYYLTIKDLDLGIDMPVSFGPNRHQGLHRVYCTVVEGGRFLPLNAKPSQCHPIAPSGSACD